MPESTGVGQLPQQWRDEATASLEKWPRGAILPSQKLRACADELVASLASLAVLADQIAPYLHHRDTCDALLKCQCGHLVREHLSSDQCVHNVSKRCDCTAFTGVDCTCGLAAIQQQLGGPEER